MCRPRPSSHLSTNSLLLTSKLLCHCFTGNICEIHISTITQTALLTVRGVIEWAITSNSSKKFSHLWVPSSFAGFISVSWVIGVSSVINGI